MARDLLVNDFGDLDIINGDFNVGFSDEQHVEHISLSNKGHYKQHPLIGVGIEDYLNSPFSLITKQKLEREISIQLKSDKAKDVVVNYNSDKLKVSAVYE